MSFPARLSLWLALLSAHFRASAAEKLPLETFFQPLQYSHVRLAPDGKSFAALMGKDWRTVLAMVDLRNGKAHVLAAEGETDIVWYRWVGSKHLIYRVRDDGFDSGGLFAVDRDSGRTSILIPSFRAQARAGSFVARGGEFLSVIPGDEERILIAFTQHDSDSGPDRPDVYSLNLVSGARKVVQRNRGDILEWLADEAWVVRLAIAEQKTGLDYLYRETADKPWTVIFHDDALKGGFRPLAFDYDGTTLYVASNRDSDTEAVFPFDLTRREWGSAIFSDRKYDAADILLSPKSRKPAAVLYDAEKPTELALDPFRKKLHQIVDAALPGKVNDLVSLDRDEQLAVIHSHSDRTPGSYYLLYTAKGQAEELFDAAPWIREAEMAEMRPISYQSRDGIQIHGYLTLPPNGPATKVPLIVNPHGGPWARDSWGWNREAQFLANRGYAVLQVNFRGSTGYGRQFLEASFKEWGAKMQDDISDGVKWAIDQGIADPTRVAIYGASYGGYAAMAGLCFTPELYRCGINYCGVTDLRLLFREELAASPIQRFMLRKMVGDPRQDAQLLKSRSPVEHADNIRVPVFMAYGLSDPRVDIDHGNRFVRALKRNDKPYKFMTKAREGHGFFQPKNIRDYYAEMERFLAEHL